MDFIYPSNIKCIICERAISKENTYSLCKDCFNELNFINDSCIKCGKPIINSILDELNTEELLHGCKTCINKTYYFDKCISCIEYNDFSKVIILGFKYNSKTYMSKYIVQIMKDKLGMENIVFDYILYVPIHKKRKKKRGFNQSKIIAKLLGESIDVEVLDCIKREKNTLRLFKLNDIDRKKELKDAFKIKSDIYKCKNKNILLIDDIFTTGSTVNELSKLLKTNGANNIYVFTVLTTINYY